MDMELQSWTRGCKQVHEIKQNKFCIECFTADFLRVFNKNVKIRPLGVRHSNNSNNFLVNSLSGDNNLVPFYSGWREIVLKREKVSKYFVQDCSMQAKNNEHIVDI